MTVGLSAISAIGTASLALIGTPEGSVQNAAQSAVQAHPVTPRQVGESFRDCRMCPEMIVAPTGTFTIGSPADEDGRRDDEGPQREIRIGYRLAVGRFEVTRWQYESFLRDTGHAVLGNCVTDRRKSGHWAPDSQTNAHDPGFAQTGSHPVACVSWHDAKAYVAWLNARTGGGYRLLSEAEWEYLARAGSTSPYPWGANIDLGCRHMNGFDTTIVARKGDLYNSEPISSAECSDGYVNTAPVGSFAPNAFGIYDMIGNLGEWVEDCATDSYAAHRSDGTHDGGDCSRRMVRGGSWGTMPRQLRTAERTRYRPADLDDSIGIRIAKDIDGLGREENE